METKQHNRTITPEHEEEARKLRALWDGTYAQRKERNLHSQEAFGTEYGIGNQAAVSFFLKGSAALSLKAARGFAAGLGCKIEDFSPRLAEFASGWPFPNLQKSDYDSLHDWQKFAIQGKVMEMVVGYQVQNSPKVSPMAAPKLVRHKHQSHAGAK